MVHHVVERDRDGVGLALHDHADGVADQDHVDTGQVDEAGERDVVGGDHGDLLAERLHPRQIGNGDLRSLMRLAGHEAVASLNRGEGLPDANCQTIDPDTDSESCVRSRTHQQSPQRREGTRAQVGVARSAAADRASMTARVQAGRSNRRRRRAVR